MRTLLVIVFSLAFIQTASSQSKNSCSCSLGGGTPEEEIPFFDPVFVGYVDKIEVDTTGSHWLDVDMTVIRSFGSEKLYPLEKIELLVLSGCGIGCGYCGFEEGEPFFVYASRWEYHDKPFVSLCSRTRPLSEAQEDLEAFDGLDLLEARSKSRCGGPDNIAALQTIVSVLLLVGLIKLRRAV